MKFNSNKERRAYWEMLIEKYPPQELEAALNSLKPFSATVLTLYYKERKTMKEIAGIINRSVTIVRNHHNRGIYKLYRYFNPRVTGIV